MGKRRGRSNAAPEVEPLDVDGVRTVAVVTVFWAAAFVVLAFFREQLVAEGYGWWLWTCLAGVGLGLLALEYTRKRRDAILEAEARTTAHDDEVDDEFDDDEDVDDAVVDPVAVAEDRKPTGPITTSPPVADERPTGPIATPGTGDEMPTPDTDLTETDHGRSGRGGRRKSRRGKGRGKGSDTRSDAASPPLDDTALTTTNPGASDPVPMAEPSTPAAPVQSPRAARSGHHVEPAPEFDTDVRAWLQLSDADVSGTGDSGAGVSSPRAPAADPAANVARPIPTRPPPRSSRPPVGRGGAVPGPSEAVVSPRPAERPRPPAPAPAPGVPAGTRPTPPSRPTPPARPTPDMTESGELPPSTPRSAPYPGDARRRSASPPPAAGRPASGPPTAGPPAPTPSAAAARPEISPPATTPPAKHATTPPAKHGGPLPRRDRSQGPSADSEFFEPIRPAGGASSGAGDIDPDAPLIETTLGGTRRRRQPIEEPEAPGSTGTDGPYRGRRARRPDSG